MYIEFEDTDLKELVVNNIGLRKILDIVHQLQ